MEPRDVLDWVRQEYAGLVETESWGETGLFYNPREKLARGTYFLTVKEKDGDNDRASRLDRDGVWRLNFAVRPDTFTELFGEKPDRPAKGEVIAGDFDFAETDVILPHPVYGWTNWVCVLSPSEATFEDVKPLIEESYDLAVERFDNRTG
jgi:hypothetical protein